MLGTGMLAAGPAAVLGSALRALRNTAWRSIAAAGVLLGAASVAAVLWFRQG